MNFCPNCGTQAASGARFCERCGTSLGTPGSSAGPAGELPPPPVAPPAAALPPQPVPDDLLVISFDDTPPGGGSVGQPAPPVQGAAVPAQSGRGRTAWVLVTVVGLLVLLGIGLMLVRNLRGETTGAGSPEAVVDELVAAIDSEDITAALQLIAPDELELADPFVSAVRRAAEDAQVVSGSNALDGIDVTLAARAGTPEELGPDAARVPVMGLRWRVDLDAAQATPSVRAFVERGDDETTATVSGEIDELWAYDDEYRFEPFVIAVRQGGRWYASPAHTALEYARVTYDLPGGDYSRRPDASTIGAASAEEAITALATAIESKQAGQVIDLMDPEKYRALHTYRSLFDQLAAEIPSSTSVSIDPQVTRTESRGGNREAVILDRVVVDAAWESWDGYEQTNVQLDGTCVRYDDDYEGRTTVCAREWGVGRAFTAATEGFFWNPLPSWVVGWPQRAQGTSPVEGFFWNPLPSWVVSAIDEPALTVSENDGRWFVDPAATVLDLLEPRLRELDGPGLLLLVAVPWVLPPEAEQLTFDTPVAVEFNADELYKTFAVPATIDDEYDDVCVFVDGRMTQTQYSVNGTVFIPNYDELRSQGYLPQDYEIESASEPAPPSLRDRLPEGMAIMLTSDSSEQCWGS